MYMKGKNVIAHALSQVSSPGAYVLGQSAQGEEEIIQTAEERLHQFHIATQAE